MNNFNAMSEFNLNGNSNQTKVSKAKRKFSRPSFDEHLNTLMTEDSHIQNSSTWVKNGDPVRIGEHLITHGNIYVGDHMIGYSGHGTECSLINPHLTHKISHEHYSDSTLAYWPKYSKISVTCRGTYLFWLSGERNDPEINLGYVFLYYYGLERRILIDYPNGIVSDDEFLDLFNEVKRLNSIYGSNKSFNGYSLSLLSYMAIMAPKIISLEFDFSSQLKITNEFKNYLSVLIQDERPWPAIIAMKWADLLTGISNRSVIHRCKQEALTLFNYYYQKEFGNGLVVENIEGFLSVKYTPASQSLSNFKSMNSKYPDPEYIGENKLLCDILSRVEKELTEYSRYIGKLENSRDRNIKNTLGAIVLLPDSYLKISNNPVVSEFQSWIIQLVSNNSYVSLSEIWLKLNMFISGKVTKKEINLLTKLLEKSGYGFCPDPRHNVEKLLFDSNIAIFKNELREDIKLCQNFMRLRALIKIGSIIFHDNEAFNFNLIIDGLISDSGLGEIEITHLRSYSSWVSKSDLSFKGLKPFVKILSEDDCRNLLYSIIKIYASSGIVSTDKLKQIEKVYALVGIDKSMLVSDLHNVSSSSYRIPVSSDTKGFKMDNEHIKKIQEETKDAQSILGEIFNENDDIEEEINTDIVTKEVSAKENSIENEGYHGLNGNNLVLFNEIKSSEEVSLEHLMHLCKKLNLMSDGAIEEINDWSFELVDAPVIEIEDMVYIDQEIIEEIESI